MAFCLKPGTSREPFNSNRSHLNLEIIDLRVNSYLIIMWKMFRDVYKSIKETHFIIIFVILMIFSLNLSGVWHYYEQDILEKANITGTIGSKRVAFCFSGNARTFRETWPSIKENVLKSLESPYDIHAVVYENEALLIQDVVSSNELAELEARNLKLFPEALPPRYFSKIRYRDSKSTSLPVTKGSFVLGLDLNTNFTLLKAFSGPYASNIDRFLQQLEGIELCGLLRGSTGVQYTHSARLRFDLQFFQPLPTLFNLFLMPVAPPGRNPEVLYTLKTQSHGGVNDKFAVGTTEALELYERQLHDTIFKWKPGVLCGELLEAKYYPQLLELLHNEGKMLATNNSGSVSFF